MRCAILTILLRTRPPLLRVTLACRPLGANNALPHLPPASDTWRSGGTSRVIQNTPNLLFPAGLAGLVDSLEILCSPDPPRALSGGLCVHTYTA